MNLPEALEGILSNSLVVFTDDKSNCRLAQTETASPPSSGPTFLRRLLIFVLAGAALGTGAFFAARFTDAAASIVGNDVRVASLKTSGLFGDIIEGRLINEGGGAEIYVWVEWQGEPGCARHTYLRTNSEYSFSFLCGRLTLSGEGELSVFGSRNPPEWVSRTATSL